MTYCSTIDDLLKSDIDAVQILVPHFFHEWYVIAAATIIITWNNRLFY